MPNLQDFAIEFDRPDTVYAPGETVSGRVVFNLAEAKNVREVRLKIRGKAKVFWSENKGAHMDHYRRKEHYFNVINQLVGSETGNEQTTLPAGEHSYTFSIELPPNLNKVLSAIHDEIEHQFLHCCCFSAGVIKINVKGQASKFAPSGESIELMVSYDRSSTRVYIAEMQLKFIKNMTFRGTGTDRQYASEVLNKVKDTGPLGKRGETLLRLVVPSVTPLNLQHCSIIDVEYVLALYIKFSGIHQSMLDDLKKIGNDLVQQKKLSPNSLLLLIGHGYAVFIY